MEEEEEPVEAATREALLKQAVEDCFIGRQFIFGIKVQCCLLLTAKST